MARGADACADAYRPVAADGGDAPGCDHTQLPSPTTRFSEGVPELGFHGVGGKLGVHMGPADLAELVWLTCFAASQLVTRFDSPMPFAAPSSPPHEMATPGFAARQPCHMLLTGGTGFLGSILITHLIENHPTACFTLLIRPKRGVDAAERLQKHIAKLFP